MHMHVLQTPDNSEVKSVDIDVIFFIKIYPD